MTNKLEKAAQKHREPLETLIPRMVAEEGSIHKAAVRLGVYPNSIRHWMKSNNYRLEFRHIAALVKEAANVK